MENFHLSYGAKDWSFKEEGIADSFVAGLARNQSLTSLKILVGVSVLRLFQFYFQLTFHRLTKIVALFQIISKS